MSEPTPRPWELLGPITKMDSGEQFFLVYAEDVQIIRLKHEGNAHLIVQAVNSHDDLLAAAKEARDELSQYAARWCEELAAKLDEAIEKAEQ